MVCVIGIGRDIPIGDILPTRCRSRGIIRQYRGLAQISVCPALLRGRHRKGGAVDLDIHRLRRGFDGLPVVRSGRGDRTLYLVVAFVIVGRIPEGNRVRGYVAAHHIIIPTNGVKARVRLPRELIGVLASTDGVIHRNSCRRHHRTLGLPIAVAGVVVIGLDQRDIQGGRAGGRCQRNGDVCGAAGIAGHGSGGSVDLSGSAVHVVRCFVHCDGGIAAGHRRHHIAGGVFQLRAECRRIAGEHHNTGTAAVDGDGLRPAGSARLKDEPHQGGVARR